MSIFLHAQLIATELIVFQNCAPKEDHGTAVSAAHHTIPTWCPVYLCIVHGKIFGAKEHWSPPHASQISHVLYRADTSLAASPACCTRICCSRCSLAYRQHWRWALGQLWRQYWRWALGQLQPEIHLTLCIPASPPYPMVNCCTLLLGCRHSLLLGCSSSAHPPPVTLRPGTFHQARDAAPLR